MSCQTGFHKKEWIGGVVVDLKVNFERYIRDSNISIVRTVQAKC